MRFVKVCLVDPSEKMPMPAPHSRLFFQAGELVDIDEPFWLARLADGSIKEAPADVEPAPAPVVVAEPVPDAAAEVAATIEATANQALPGIPTSITDMVAAL